MGQIKNIKLHIVTDIKEAISPIKQTNHVATTRFIAAGSTPEILHEASKGRHQIHPGQLHGSRESRKDRGRNPSGPPHTGCGGQLRSGCTCFEHRTSWRIAHETYI